MKSDSVLGNFSAPQIPAAVPPRAVHTADDAARHACDPRDSWGVTREHPGLIRRIRRAVAVLRYYRPAQLIWRGWKLARSRWEAWSGGGRYAVWPEVLPVIRRDPGLQKLAGRKLVARRRRDTRDRAARFRQGRYRFLQQELELSPLDARLAGHGELPLLWRFHFHYHEFLLDTFDAGLETDDRQQIADAWQFVRSWIDSYPLSDPRTHADAWHPFCISRRLPVWVALWMVAPPAPAAQPRILGSLLQQARFLSGHLEWDLGGNHLLENLRALAISAAFLAGAESQDWLRHLRRIIPAQLRKQVLEHGEHFERCPMYHALMLEAVLDMRDALEQLAPAISGTCREAAVRMADFLEQILPPDGELPLLGDSAWEEAPSSRVLIDAAEQRRPLREVRDTGAVRVGPYWIWKEGAGHQLLLDAGPVGADSLPAHAHCDLLNLEISLGGLRLVVDSGVFNYADDAARQYCRSTAAHNTLQIDGQDQCDVWSRFRMGDRGRPTALLTGEAHGFAWARASHDAYRRLGVPTVARWIACRPGGPWLIVDGATGQGTHRLTNRLHLHPDVEAILEDESRVALVAGDQRLVVSGIGQGKLTIETGWFCPEFGKRLHALVLVWEATASLPAVCGWCFSPDSDCPPPTLSVDQHDGIHVRWPDEDRPCQWNVPWQADRTASRTD